MSIRPRPGLVLLGMLSGGMLLYWNQLGELIGSEVPTLRWAFPDLATSA